MLKTEEKRAMRGLIIAAGSAVKPALLRRLAGESDLVAAVDGGYRHCVAAGIVPGLLLGDMDSLGGEPALENTGTQVVRLPREKDDTDTIFAIRRLAELGCKHITLTCALGGRLDHTVANLCALGFCLACGAAGELVDDDCSAAVVAPGEYAVKREDYILFSLFPLDGACAGVCIQNARYPLDGYMLESGYPIGISNEFLEGDARIIFASGRLLVIRSRIY